MRVQWPTQTFAVGKRGVKKKRDFTKKALWVTLSWPNLGLHLEISRLEISPRKLLDPILATSWASSGKL